MLQVIAFIPTSRNLKKIFSDKKESEMKIMSMTQAMNDPETLSIGHKFLSQIN